MKEFLHKQEKKDQNMQITKNNITLSRVEFWNCKAFFNEKRLNF